MNNDVVLLNEDTSIHASCLIIMPIFNRRNFLTQAFASLSAQTMPNWRLVIVDDGSQDESLELVKELASTIDQSVTYVYQQNAGPGAARDKGRDFLQDEDYVAFFDSDDIWLPGYLMRMTSLLARTPDLYWLFCACKRVNLDTGETLLESTHYDETTGQKSAFFNLPIASKGDVQVFTDNKNLAYYQIDQPLNAGFQNSVLKSEVIKKISIPHYRIGEDRFFLLDTILSQFKVGFIEDVLVLYSVHQSNISDTNMGEKSSIKSIKVQMELVDSYRRFSYNLVGVEFKNYINMRADSILFWNVAYSIYVQNGYYKQALNIMIPMVFSRRFKLKFLKTCTFTIFKFALNSLSRAK